MSYPPQRRYGLDPMSFAALERQITKAADRMTKEQLLDLADELHAAVRRHNRQTSGAERSFNP